MKRILLIFCFFICTVFVVNAQTVAENFMCAHKDVKSAKYVEAKGARMTMVRPFLSKRSIAPVLEFVDGFTMLKLQHVDADLRDHHISDLLVMLKSYTYYGQWNSQDGIVDVYVNPSDPYSVEEIVVYNPSIMTLYSMIGKFPIERLLKLTGAVNSK